MAVDIELALIKKAAPGSTCCVCKKMFDDGHEALLTLSPDDLAEAVRMFKETEVNVRQMETGVIIMPACPGPHALFVELLRQELERSKKLSTPFIYGALAVAMPERRGPR